MRPLRTPSRIAALCPADHGVSPMVNRASTRADATSLSLSVPTSSVQRADSPASPASSTTPVSDWSSTPWTPEGPSRYGATWVTYSIEFTGRWYISDTRVIVWGDAGAGGQSDEGRPRDRLGRHLDARPDQAGLRQHPDDGGHLLRQRFTRRPHRQLLPGHRKPEAFLPCA